MRKVFFVLCLCLSYVVNGQSNLDSLWSVWEDETLADTVRLEALKKYGWDGYLFVDQDSAIYFSQVQYDYAKAKGEQAFMAGALNNMGIAYDIKGTHQIAIKKYKAALKIYESINHEKGIAGTLTNIGIIYERLGNYGIAVDYYFKSVKVFEAQGDQKRLAKALNNIGNIYYDQNYYDLALKYHLQSLAIKNILDDDDEIASSYLNIGMVYGGAKHYDSAFYYTRISVDIYDEVENQYGWAIAMNNLGTLYSYLKSDSAIYCFEASLNTFESLDLQDGVLMNLISIGTYEKEKGNAKKAEAYLLDAWALSKTLDEVKQQMHIAESLKEIYHKQKAYQAAYEMYTTFNTLRDSIESKKNKNTVINLNYKYDYEKQALLDSLEFAKKDELKSLEIKEQQAQLEKEEMQRYALYGGIGLLLLLGGSLWRSYRRKQNDNELIKSQHQALQASHIEITDSIDYAKRLQDAILPALDELSHHLPSYFVLFKPKDIVSGDFYWFENTAQNIKLFAVADCTGHGVPGAMVSLVCSSALNRSVKEFGLVKPADILNKTRALVIETFAKSGKGIRDGMDIALCALDGDLLHFVGANNPLWLIRATNELEPEMFINNTKIEQNGLTLIEIGANKQPVGLTEKMADFTAQTFVLKPHDKLYLFTDGYADQFGGPANKKFKKNALRSLILDIQREAMAQQKLILEEKIEVWRGEVEQIDDICIMGIKIQE